MLLFLLFLIIYSSFFKQSAKRLESINNNENKIIKHRNTATKKLLQIARNQLVTRS